MALNSNALTTVNDLLAYMGTSLPSTELFSIYHDESDSATAATVQVTSTVLQLVVTTGANAGTYSLTLSGYASVTALVAAINVADIGFLATVEAGNGATDPTELDVLAAVSCFGAAAVQYPAGRSTIAYEQAINQASAHIEHICARSFNAADHTHMYHGRGHKKLVLRQRPIISVSRVAIGRQEAFRVKNTSTDAVQANFALESAKARLDVIGGVNNDKGNSVAYTSTTTLDTFVAAIIAIGKGWTAEVVDSADGAWLVTDCFDFESYNALSDWMSVWVPRENQDQYNVDKEAGVLYRAGWGSTLSPMVWGSATWMRWSQRPVELRPLNAESAAPYWPDGTFNIYVSFRAGYETIPSDVAGLCLEYAKLILMNAPRNTALTGENVEGYSWTAASSGASGRTGGEDAFTQRLRSKLEPYRIHIAPRFLGV